MSDDKKFTYKAQEGDRFSKQVIIDDRGALVELYPNFITRKDALQLFELLKEEIPWQREQVQLNDQFVEPPRLVAVLGEPGTKYRYSGSIKTTSGWHTSVEKIKNQIKDQFRQDYNFVLCNLYRDGSDSIGWHSDAEDDILEDSIIASVSLGAKREFYLQSKQTEKITTVPLTSGSLLLMRGKTQKLYRHAVLKEPHVQHSRINMTFRLIIYKGTQEEEDKLVSIVSSTPVEKKAEPEKEKESGEPQKAKHSRVQGRGAPARGGRLQGRGPSTQRGRGWGSDRS